ncbi:inorganic diphosphatase [Candidatus Roizmanbacteria bacterium]|nr:inorganic diphosphatase [Candidatus Roizmanbacteria bacterium]
MNLTKLAKLKHSTDKFAVVIEIPMGSMTKYEVDKDSETIFVDRFAFTTMGYPLNYGFIPGTQAGDGDPVDVLVLSTYPVHPGAAMYCRAIGVLMMEDEAGMDEKILAVPVAKVDPFQTHIRDIADVPDAIKNKIKHFFEHYKELEPGKWVKVREWKGKTEAEKAIREGMK